MPKARKREWIQAVDLDSISGLHPTCGVSAIGGVRVHDIGQGDAISILDENLEPFLQIDYGGKVGNIFRNQIDQHVPVKNDSLVMLSHWDEDHWYSAPMGVSAKAATWLVPRQITSPRAVMFSTTLPKIYCVPEAMVGQTWIFTTTSGDQVCWEKIASAPPANAEDEDCNRTGIAFSVVKKNPGGGAPQVVLLPGDAAFGKVKHYEGQRKKGYVLRGMVAFHHGSKLHICKATQSLLSGWTSTANSVDIVFSCASNNSFGHPDFAFYAGLPYANVVTTTTPDIRVLGNPHHDVLF